MVELAPDQFAFIAFASVGFAFGCLPLALDGLNPNCGIANCEKRAVVPRALCSVLSGSIQGGQHLSKRTDGILSACGSLDQRTQRSEHRTVRPVVTEQTSRSSAQEIDTRFSLACKNTNLFVERLEKDKDRQKRRRRSNKSGETRCDWTTNRFVHTARGGGH